MSRDFSDAFTRASMSAFPLFVILRVLLHPFVEGLGHFIALDWLLNDLSLLIGLARLIVAAFVNQPRCCFDFFAFWLRMELVSYWLLQVQLYLASDGTGTK